MTEQEWLACEDPRPLLEFLDGTIVVRKVRYFVLACSQRIWSDWSGDATGVALGVAKHLVETGTALIRTAVVRVPVGEAVLDCGASEWDVRVKARIPGRAEPGPALPVQPVLEHILTRLACGHWTAQALDWLVTQLERCGLPLAHQADLLRDIVRPPFRRLLFRGVWRLENGGAVGSIVRVIHQELTSGHEAASEHYPVLADALEDAGCREAEVLEHLRFAGPHVRGCWVLDHLVGTG
jgi:hypothetical protein